MNAYLWDQQGRRISLVTVQEPVPRVIAIPTVDARFERVFWRCMGRTISSDLKGDPRLIGFDYEEGIDSPRKVEAV